MGRKRAPGLIKRGGVWHIEKRVKGYGRLRESTGTSDYGEAERTLNHRLEELRSARVYGIRPDRTFREAAAKFLAENTHLRALDRCVYALDAVMPFIGDLPLRQVHMGTLGEYRKIRSRQVGQGTINKELSVVRRILNLAARVWRDEHGLSWLETAPLIEIRNYQARKPYPLSWDEQRELFSQLPGHLARMCEFKVNTGLREKEVCRLKWRWEHPDLPVFVIPGQFHKNGEDRIVVLNSVARRIVDGQRGEHPDYVFTYEGHPLKRINNHAFRKARNRAGIPHARVHDLKHTFGYRLRAAGVGFEDRQDLLGHKSGRITTHYCAADVDRLLEAAEKVTRKCPQNAHRALSFLTAI